jgi:hypothetical protein
MVPFSGLPGDNEHSPGQVSFFLWLDVMLTDMLAHFVTP